MMMKLRESLLVLLLCSLSWSAWALDFGRIRDDEIAIYVQDLASGQVLWDHRSEASVNPASTMKLVTAFASLQALGKDYRWRTELKSPAVVQGDTLYGDIYWIGSGDPSLDQNGLIALQQQLRSKGIRKITGQLVLDRSLWGDVKNAKEFAADGNSIFMMPPDPNNVAYNTVSVKVGRTPAGETEIMTNPPLPEIQLDNQTAWSDSTAACHSVKWYLHQQYHSGIWTFRGHIPASCQGEELHVNLFSATDFARRSFINQWRAGGGEISDGLRIETAPATAKTLAAIQSKPLGDILTDMNKFSNNLIARSVFLKLGQVNNQTEALQRAAAKVRLELELAGVDTTPLILENGSGLSRQERVSAKMMGQLLEKAYYSPLQQEFIHTLPIAGTDGTLKTRLRQAGNHLHLKTGTLNNVRALAGYWLGEQPKIVVVIINSPKAEAYLKDLDRIVSEIVLPGGKNWVSLATSCEIRLPV